MSFTLLRVDDGSRTDVVIMAVRSTASDQAVQSRLRCLLPRPPRSSNARIEVVAGRRVFLKRSRSDTLDTYGRLRPDEADPDREALDADLH